MNFILKAHQNPRPGIPLISLVCSIPMREFIVTYQTLCACVRACVCVCVCVCVYIYIYIHIYIHIHIYIYIYIYIYLYIYILSRVQVYIYIILELLLNLKKIIFQQGYRLEIVISRAKMNKKENLYKLGHVREYKYINMYTCKYVYVNI